MSKAENKYRIAYDHLWETYGSSWQLRISYILQLLTRICKLIALPIAISLIISRLSSQDYDGAKDAVLIFVVFSLTLGILTPLVKYIGMKGENIKYREQTADYFEKLVTADIDYFNSNLSGYLTAATRQYVDGCIMLIRNIRDKYMGTILSIVFPLAIIAWIDTWLGIVAIGLSLVQAVYLFWASKAIDPLRSQSRELYKINSGKMADVISNILAVRSNAQEATYVKQVKEGAIKEAHIFSKRYALQAKLIGLREVISVLFFMILLWLTVQRMSTGNIDITAAVLVVTYSTTILTGIYSMSNDLDEHDDLIDKIMPAFEVINKNNMVSDPQHPKQFTKVRGDINFKDVTFAYENNNSTILENFNLNIPHKQKIGIVGLSGAGKSTLAKLVLRFDDINSGSIKIDDIDIRDVKQTELRKQIAFVPQEPLLFHTSVRDNVLLSQPDASDESVMNALKTAHATQFINQLPDGIDSIVGERGVKLSGGQKQRIAIARAVLRNAPIIILDEATSALDSESEQIIKDSFAEILKGKTAIVIAHRLSTLSEMDRIVVIEKGKIVEDGTHNHLISQKGAYAKLWKHQLRHREEDMGAIGSLTTG